MILFSLPFDSARRKCQSIPASWSCRLSLPTWTNTSASHTICTGCPVPQLFVGTLWGLLQMILIDFPGVLSIISWIFRKLGAMILFRSLNNCFAFSCCYWILGCCFQLLSNFGNKRPNIFPKESCRCVALSRQQLQRDFSFAEPTSCMIFIKRRGSKK